MKREDIAAGVRQCLGDVLDASPEAIQEQQKIIDDLGADSLDLLDLIFRLEQRFHVSISPRDIERRAREALGDVPMEIDGVYTAAGLLELRKALPEVPPEELTEGLTTLELPGRLRVATMVNLVSRLLEENRG